MAIQKPSKPNVVLPNNFGGVKTPYTQAQIDNGYQEAVPQVVDGGNINYEKDAVFKYLKYLKTVIDALVDMPIGKSIVIDANNRFEYISPENSANKTGTINASSTATQYPTAKAVYDAIKGFNPSLFLHRSGDETFSGVKTGQSNNPLFGFKHTEIDITTAPAERKSARIFFSDKNNKWISEIGVYKNTDNGVISQITANNDTAGVASLQIFCKKDGTKYATCPTPPAADDNSTKISTTKWVNSRITSIMNTTTKKSGYINLNGLIIQWGEAPVTTSSTTTYTFNIPFTNASSVVCVKNYQSSHASFANDSEMSIWGITKTGFKTQGVTQDTAAFQWLAIGY